MSTIDDGQIENALRRSPRPRAPGNLKAKLLTQTKASSSDRTARPSATRGVRPGWFQQWWRVLAPACAFLVCLFVLGVQQQEFRNRRQNLQTLTSQPESTAPGADAGSADAHNASQVPAASETEEIAKLKETVSRLTAEISKLEQLRTENQNLRSQLSTPSPSQLSPKEVAAMNDQKDRATMIQCANNMKQMCIAVRVWAGDNDEVSPPDIISMTNELWKPKVLWCPADAARSMAKDWSTYTDANCSYEYLAPSATNTWSAEPDRVLFRCPIHGNIGLCDGSVQMEVEKIHPESLVRRDGKLYFQPNP
jgi:hypothetical protein